MDEEEVKSAELSPEVRAKAEALVREYFSQCFWFWRPDARVGTDEMLELVIQYLRSHGGRKGWRAAAELQRCR